MVMRFVGASVQRVEDPRILTGRGRYVDDVQLPGMLHAAFVRSTVPHARIVSIDTAAARALPGVSAVLVAADLAAAVYPLQVLAGPFTDYKEVPFTALASDKVRTVGDPVAVVVAESRYVAEDAAALVTVEFELLEPVTDAAEALEPGSAQVFDDVPGNLLYHSSHRHGDTDAAFAEADRVIERRITQHRYAAAPMETGGGVADFSVRSGELTYYASSRRPHALSIGIAGFLGMQSSRVRVMTGDVGGAFGQKGSTLREDLVISAASRLLRRPVKWIEDRRENLAMGGQAREEWVDVAMAVRADGTILGMRASLVMDHGAYPTVSFPSSIIAEIMRLHFTSAYRIPAFDFDCKLVCTNKGSYVFYRGPWEMETFVRERMIDIVAGELGLDPVDVRLRNLMTTDEQPVMSTTGLLLEGVTARETLERAVELADIPGFREEQARAREQGRYLGIGFSTYIEAAPGPPGYFEAMGFDLPPERAQVRVEPDGSVLVMTGQSPGGQGQETTIAQVVADDLGVELDQVRVIVGDSRLIPFNIFGTAGSRGATMGTGAALTASHKIKEQMLAIAATLLEAGVEDLELTGGMAQVRGVPSRAVPFTQIAQIAYFVPGLLGGAAPGLEAVGDFDAPRGGWTQATHCCVVEVDIDTGRVAIPRYLVVEDCGTVINPAILTGQVQGAVAQGIGGVLYERSAYDENGQFVASTFTDYLVPTVLEIPRVELHHLEFPPLAEVNSRGAGEGGTIASPVALVNAITDALAPFGVSITEQHLPPSRILELAGVIEAEPEVRRAPSAVAGPAT